MICPFALIVILALAAPDAAPAGEFVARVTWVKDGDSFVLEYDTGDGAIRDECRMWYYNAPEYNGRYPELAEDAKRYLISLIAGKGKSVKIRTKGRRDKYGRQICDVYLMDGTSVTELMRERLRDYPGLDQYKWLY